MNITNPLDRIRRAAERPIESGENCQSVFLSMKDGHEASFYYSYLRAAKRDDTRLVLMHTSATIIISGQPESLSEIHRLVSQQRLAGIREDGLQMEINWLEGEGQ
jgi:hypothetical protein